MRWYHILLLPFAAVACSSSDSGPALLADGEKCSQHSECQSGYCREYENKCEATAALLERCYGRPEKCSEGECHSPIPKGIEVCTVTCASDTDCEGIGGLCVEGWCIKPCGPDDDYGVLYGACVDGRPVPCTDPVAQEAECKTCGCGVGRTCVNDACVAQFEDGHACSQDTDCLSLNCGVPSSAPQGSTARVCLVGVGEPCTYDNCEHCELGLFCSKKGCANYTTICDAREGAGFKTTCVDDHVDSWCAGACETTADCSPWPGYECKPFSNSSQGYCGLFECFKDADCAKWPGTVCDPTDLSGRGFCLKP